MITEKGCHSGTQPMEKSMPNQYMLTARIPMETFMILIQFNEKKTLNILRSEFLPLILEYLALADNPHGRTLANQSSLLMKWQSLLPAHNALEVKQEHEHSEQCKTE